MRWIARGAAHPLTFQHLLTVALTSGAVAAIALMMAICPVSADDGTSQAKSWNLNGEEKARFEATVVDVLCELSGDCPANCGDGGRILGLKRTDGTLVLVNKNVQPIFSGAVADLLPYCNKQVEVDGLFAGFDETQPKAYQVQLIREVGAAEFTRTTLWSKQWNADNPDLAAQKGPWFRKEPRINAIIARDGYLGLGPQTDKEVTE